MKMTTIMAVAGRERGKIDFTCQKRGCVFQDKKRRSKDRVSSKEVRDYFRGGVV